MPGTITSGSSTLLTRGVVDPMMFASWLPVTDPVGPGCASPHTFMLESIVMLPFEPMSPSVLA